METSNSKVLLTGAHGLIGSRLVELLKNFEVVGVSSEDFDLTDAAATETFVQKIKPDTVIHLAAFTDTERAETERELCRKVNVGGTQNLINAISKLHNVKFIYLSTDHVFDGKKGGYVEGDLPNPVNYYGQTKLEAENLVASVPNSLIIRTSYPFRTKFEPKADVIRWMLPKLKNGESLTLVNDQHITPTFVDDLARVCETAVNNQLTGIYHVAGSSCLTFFEMGTTLAREFGFNPELIKAIALEDFIKQSGRKAGQPKKGCLNCTKLENETGIKMKSFEEAVKMVKTQMEANK